eukprot:5731679-Pleurochrysis_carterae.AAC.1
MGLTLLKVMWRSGHRLGVRTSDVYPPQRRHASHSRRRSQRPFAATVRSHDKGRLRVFGGVAF